MVLPRHVYQWFVSEAERAEALAAVDLLMGLATTDAQRQGYREMRTELDLLPVKVRAKRRAPTRRLTTVQRDQKALYQGGYDKRRRRK